MTRPDHFEIDTTPTGTIITKGYWKHGVYRDVLSVNETLWKLAITPIGHKDFSASIWQLDGDGQVEYSNAKVIKAIYSFWEGPRRE